MARSRRTPHEVEQHILDVADRLFYTQGYRATGVNQIIEEAAVAKASFYGHFATKEALGLAYLRGRHERWFAELRDVVNGARTPRRRALAAFVFLERWLLRVQFRGCAFLNLLGEGSLPTSLGARILDHKSELRAFFGDSVAALCGTRTEARALGDHLLLLFEGAILEAQVHGELWPVKTAAKLAGGLVPAG